MRGRLSLLIFAFGVFLVSLLWGVVLLKVSAEKEAAIGDVKKHTANLARAVEEHAVRTIREADQVLLFLQHQYSLQGAKPDLRRLIEDGPILSRIYTLLSVIDERGDLVAASQPFKPMNLADREHFRAHVAQEILNPPFISKPVVGRASGKASIQLTRRINKPDQSFGGVAVVSLDPAYLSKFYGQLDIGSHGRALLIGFDGVVRAHRGEASLAISPEAMKRLMGPVRPGDSGSRILVSPVDGMTRIFSYRVLTDYPLVVAVGANMDQALADYTQRQREYFAGAGLISLLILVATAILMALTSKQRSLTHQMRMIADSVPAAIAYYDAELRCRFANQGFCEMHQVAPERIVGMTLADITGAQVYGLVSQTLSALRQGKAEKFRRTQHNRAGEERTIEVYRTPDMSPEGEFRGIYVMVLDVTEQVQAETAIRASEAEVRAAQQRLENILSTLREVVYSRSPDNSEVYYVSPPVERLYGHPAQAFISDPALWVNSVHPADRERVVSSAALLLHEGSREIEYRIVRADGEIRTLQSVAHVVRDERGRAARVDGVLTDITERRLAEERSNHLAQHDLLTGLPNRVLFRDRLALARKRAKRRGETLGVILLGLDRFKQVNESLGHEAGDDLLRQVAARLRECLREEDTVGRLGGDEFAILAEGMAGAGDVAAVVEKIHAALAAPFQLKGSEVFTSPSIGIAVYPNGGGNSQTLLEHADLAMRRVKQEGGGGHQYYSAGSGPERGQRIALDSRLRHALKNGELALHYQPKVSFESGAVTGVEALLRWNNSELGPISPAQFIPIAEETGLIVPIGEWVLRTACAQAKAWEREGLHLAMAVNLSPRQFRQANLTGMVAAVLAESGLAPERLELEITESTAMIDPQQASVVLGELRQLGVQLAVDDFGTGHSSLNYLKRFPLNRLKIDRSFVKDIGADSHDEAIINATVALAHGMKLKLTAEGVENEVQRDFLARSGCDDYQGYFFSRPLPAPELLALLRVGQPQAA